jgi:hypothetical protein
MVGYEQIRKGLVTYINRDIVPLAPKAVGIGIAAFAPAIAEAKLKELLASPLLANTGLVEGNSVDIDMAIRLLKPAAEGKWPVEMFGFTFTESDLDKLYRYIKES